jgi:V/A-type H+-transporting ATPase subunit I
VSHTPMLKCTLVMRAKDSESVLEALQDAALVHVREIEMPAALADQISDRVVLDDASFVDDAALLAQDEALSRRIRALGSVAPAPLRLQENGLSYADVERTIDALADEEKALVARRAALSAQEKALAPFGEIDPEDIRVLARAGVRVVFARLSRDEWDALDRQRLAGALQSVDDRAAHVVFFVRAGEELPAKVTPLELPERALSSLTSEIDDVDASLRRVHRELGRLAHFRAAMVETRAALGERLALVRARKKGAFTGALFALEGYIPESEAFTLEATLAKRDVAYRIEQVAVDDKNAPVKLKNGWLTKGFEDVVKAFSGVAYHEKDFTWSVGILFVVFGALCLLDGGYGLLLALTGLILRARGVDGFGRVFLVTGVFSTILGALSGQYFGLVVGQHIFKEYRPLLTLSQIPYDAFIFSLIVGMFAIPFSHIVAIWKRGFKTPSTGALVLVLATWVLVFANMLGGYVLKVLSGWTPPSPELLADVARIGNTVGIALLVLSVLLFVVYPDPVFGPKARAGNVMWTLYSGPTGFLQDLLSHMRLFGISLSGAIMALVVNDIGARFPLPVTVVFAIVGHLFVYVLSLLSLYIHTNRLIFLEFGSKCIDGGHNFYSPLRRLARGQQS